jgi:hypothetical protein
MSENYAKALENPTIRFAKPNTEDVLRILFELEKASLDLQKDVKAGVFDDISTEASPTYQAVTKARENARRALVAVFFAVSVFFVSCNVMTDDAYIQEISNQSLYSLSEAEEPSPEPTESPSPTPTPVPSPVEQTIELEIHENLPVTIQYSKVQYSTDFGATWHTPRATAYLWVTTKSWAEKPGYEFDAKLITRIYFQSDYSGKSYYDDGYKIAYETFGTMKIFGSYYIHNTGMADYIELRQDNGDRFDTNEFVILRFQD